MNGIKSLCAAIATIALLAGCSGAEPTAGRGTPTGSAKASRDQKAATSTRTASPGATASPAGGKTTRVPRPPKDEDDGEFTTVHTFPMMLRVDPPCVAQGQSASAIVVTEPNVSVVVSVVFADGQPHNTWGNGISDKEGRFIFKFIIPATAPEGAASADVIGGRTTPDGEDEVATAEAPFEVALPGGCG